MKECEGVVCLCFEKMVLDGICHCMAAYSMCRSGIRVSYVMGHVLSHKKKFTFSTPPSYCANNQWLTGSKIFVARRQIGHICTNCLTFNGAHQHYFFNIYEGPPH